MRLILMFIFAGWLGAQAVPLSAAPQRWSCAQQKELSAAGAAAAVRRLQERYRGIETMTAVFQQESYLAAMDMSEVGSGRLWLRKPDMMKWEYEQPDPQFLLVRGSEFWFYQPEDNQVVIDDVRKVLLPELPLTFLMGLGDLEADFSVGEACEDNSGLLLLLKSRRQQTTGGDRSELKSLSLRLALADAMPAGVQVVDNLGNITTIRLSDTQLNSDLADSLFELKLPRGVDRIDRR